MTIGACWLIINCNVFKLIWNIVKTRSLKDLVFFEHCSLFKCYVIIVRRKSLNNILGLSFLPNCWRSKRVFFYNRFLVGIIISHCNAYQIFIVIHTSFLSSFFTNITKRCAALFLLLSWFRRGLLVLTISQFTKFDCFKNHFERCSFLRFKRNCKT